MPYVESFDGSNIYYEMKGEGLPVILLPCVGATLDYWKYQEPLAEKYKLVTIDTAGIGKSTKSHKEYLYSSLAQDVKAVIIKEHLDKVVIVGHSFGGVIALETAKILQEKIAGIIVIDSLIPKTVYYGLKATEEKIAEEMKSYEGDYQEYYDNLLRNMLGGRVSPEIEAWFLSIAGYEAFNPTILRNMVRQMLLHDYHDIIEQVTCPIKYLLRGAYREVEYILEEQKGARFIDNVGHMSNIEDPETFNKIIDEMIQEIGKGT